MGLGAGWEFDYPALMRALGDMQMRLRGCPGRRPRAPTRPAGARGPVASRFTAMRRTIPGSAYSARIATIGSTRSARRVGTTQASRHTPSMNAA